MNVLEAATTKTDLAVSQTEQTEMLSFALAHAGLAVRLSEIDPHAIFKLRASLTKPEHDKLTSAYIEVAQIAQSAPARARAAAEELAVVLDELPESQRQRLAQQIATEPFASSQPHVYLPIVELRPEFLYEGPVDSAFQRWSSGGMASDSADLEVFTLGFKAGRGAQHLPGFISNLGTLIEKNAGDNTALHQVLTVVSRSLERVPNVDDEPLRELVAALGSVLSTRLPTGDNEIPSDVLAVLYRLNQLGAVQSAPDVISPLVASLATERPLVIAEAVSESPPAPPLRDLLLTALIRVISPTFGIERMRDAANAVLAIDLEDGAERLAQQLSTLISQSQIDELPELTLAFRNQLGARVNVVVTGLLDRAHAVSAIARQPILSALTEVAEIVDGEGRQRLTDLLYSMLTSTVPEEVDAGTTFIETLGGREWSSETRLALDRAASTIAQAPFDPMRLQGDSEGRAVGCAAL